MKITFPYWGNYTIAFKSLFKKLGFCIVPPEKTNSRTIEEGAKISPEMYCLPLKINLGNYLSAIRRGADTVFMVTSLGGSCRLRYYGAIQKKVLSDAGYDVNFIVFDQTPKDIYKKIKEVSGASFWQVVKACWFFYEKLRLIEKLEKKANYLRPREKVKGKTDKVLMQAFLNLDKINTRKELAKFKKETKKKISEIEIDKNKNVPKVGLVGEIFTVSDGAVNFGIEEKLGKEGVEVHREMDITYHLKKRVFPWKDWLIQRRINPYLRSTVGGHGRDAIDEMLNYVKTDFDGIVHLLPFGCFLKDTNITMEGYLQKPIQDIKVGEKVLTHRGRFKKVTQTFCRDYRGEILKIDCGGKLLTVSVTPEHPFLLAKQKTKKSPIFVKAINVKTGDSIVTPKNMKFSNKKRVNKFKNPEDYFLVPIRKIETVNFKGKVYNLEVENDHSYVANFLIAHNCMPEVTVRPILQKIHLESGIPFLSLSLDEQVAEAGINTRIEAFVDVVKNYHEQKRNSYIRKNS